jgi:hypothetical protein
MRKNFLLLLLISGIFSFIGAQIAQAEDSSQMAAEANTLTLNTVTQWSQHQRTTGVFIPRLGVGGYSGYGLVMLAQSMISQGVSTSNSTLISDGIVAESYEVEHPDNGGFELLALSEAYSYDSEHLSADEAWLVLAPKMAVLLQSKTEISANSACYHESKCYENLKLVSAIGELSLLETGLTSEVAGTLLSEPAKIDKWIMQLLNVTVPANTGADANGSASAFSFKDAGIISDPKRNPLAYESLSTDMIGHAIQMLGAKAPKSLISAFFRASKALVGLMAPNGDIAYIGRGQGQVWNVATTVDALATAAAYTSDPQWKGRFLDASKRALARLESVYPDSGWGLALVPRQVSTQLDDSSGIDGYANVIEYNGLALWALGHAAQTLASIPVTELLPISADMDGYFLDPSHTGFAAVRHENLWYAIHWGSTDGDSRYDFGVDAVQKMQPDGSFKEVLPYRPMTTNERTSAGPSLASGSGELVAVGKSISVSGDKVVVKGGWAAGSGSKLTHDPGTIWTFAPVENGVAMSFHALAHRAYQFQVFYQTGSTYQVNGNQVTITDVDGEKQFYSFNVPTKITTEIVSKYHSAYEENISSLRLTASTTHAQTLVYTEQF